MKNIRLFERGIGKRKKTSKPSKCLVIHVVSAILICYPGFAKTVWSGLPEGTYMGLGTAQLDLSSDIPYIGSPGGGSFQGIFGRYASQSFSGEIVISGGLRFNTGPVPDPYYPEDSAEYGYFMFGFRYHLMDLVQSKISPWIGLGWTMHDIMWNTYFYNITDTGFTPYAGVDVLPFGKNVLLRIELKKHSFSAPADSSEGSSKISVSEFNISLGYLFQ